MQAADQAPLPGFEPLREGVDHAAACVWGVKVGYGGNLCLSGPFDRPRSSGRLEAAPVGCNCSLGGPGHRVARVGAAFRRALRSPAVLGVPVGVPARLRACSQARPRRAESAGRSGRRAMPQHARRRLKSAPSPGGCRNSLGVGRVARRARLAAKPFSRPLPRLTLKAGHKAAGLPTTPVATCSATSTGFCAAPLFMRKTHLPSVCIEIY